MEEVYRRYQHIVVVCVDCYSGITIPVGSRDVVRLKRSGAFKPSEPNS